MTINLLVYRDGKIIDGILFSKSKLIIYSDNKDIFFQEDRNENKNQEIGIIKKEGDIFLLENKSLSLSINNIKADLVQLETDDVISYLDIEILVKIYPFEIEKASLIIDDKEQKEYKIFKTLTFIGNQDIADIPAQSKNPLMPISDYSAAIIIRENDYHLIPINHSVVKFRMKELKFDIKLENGTSFEVGASKFIFKKF